MIFAKKVHINLHMWIFFCTFASRIEKSYRLRFSCRHDLSYKSPRQELRGKQVKILCRPAAVYRHRFAFGNKIAQIALSAIKATCAFALPKTNLKIAFGDAGKPKML